MARFRIEALKAAHDRTTFSSGSAPLDAYFQNQLAQDIRRRVTACFVALDAEQCIAGYFTLASASVLLADLPSSIGKKLPRYPSVPTVRLGRLAVDQRFKGLGLGAAPMRWIAPLLRKSPPMPLWSMPKTNRLRRSIGIMALLLCQTRR